MTIDEVWKYLFLWYVYKFWDVFKPIYYMNYRKNNVYFNYVIWLEKYKFIDKTKVKIFNL